jgi:DNA-directed RNA polymerase subunit RPC12/RpoP
MPGYKEKPCQKCQKPFQPTGGRVILCPDCKKLPVPKKEPKPKKPLTADNGNPGNVSDRILEVLVSMDIVTKKQIETVRKLIT